MIFTFVTHSKIYFVEFYGCTNFNKRLLYRKELEKAGITITDEKLDFNKNIIKYYITINQINSQSLDKVLDKLKKSEYWHECAWAYKLPK